MRVTLPFLIMPGKVDLVIVGNKTLRKILDMNVMRQLNELFREIGGGTLDPVHEHAQVCERGIRKGANACGDAARGRAAYCWRRRQT